MIAGQGTVGLELAAQAAEAGVARADVLVCCGGGGLSAGIALALEAEAPGLRVRTVEPARLRRHGALARRGPSGRQPGDDGLDLRRDPDAAPGGADLSGARKLAGPGLAVTDGEALAAMALAFRHLRIVLEPGGAVSLAAAVFRGDAIGGDAVICVASGGNVDAARFAAAITAGG